MLVMPWLFHWLEGERGAEVWWVLIGMMGFEELILRVWKRRLGRSGIRVLQRLRVSIFEKKIKEILACN